jgi:hypothetical protein
MSETARTQQYAGPNRFYSLKSHAGCNLKVTNIILRSLAIFTILMKIFYKG